MAVPRHRISGAQVCAGAATGPALIWTSDPTADWLASGGVPVWYDQHGGDHQAGALLPPATSRQATTQHETTVAKRVQHILVDDLAPAPTVSPPTTWGSTASSTRST